MAGLSTGAGAPTVKVYHEKSMILPDVSRVLACLYEKDVKFECVKDSYKDILRLQASRSVPVPFYDGPTFLQESRAICRYIAETYEQRGYPFLLGKDVLERASIEQWLRHEEHAFDPPSRALFCHLAFPLHDEDNDDINREKRKLEEVLAVYEQRLGESEFLAGDKFTLADLVHLPSTHHIVTSEKFAYLYDSRKNVQRWWNTISTRDSWQQVLRNMKSVEELEELEQQQLLLQQQQQQWQAEPPPTSGYRNIRIDPGKQKGTESRTILVPPPSAGQKSKAQPTDLKVKSPLEAELKEDTQGVMSGDERFSTKRLRKMLKESEAAEPPPTSGGRNIRMDPRKQTGTESRTILVPPPSASQQRLGKMFEENEAEEVKSQSTDSQAPEKEETPSVYKKPSDVQDRKSQADTVLADGKTGTPSTGTQAPDTPTSADERRATPPPKGEMARDDRGATEPRKPPSSNEQESQQRSEQEKMTSTDQRAAENMAVKDAQGETASQARHRGARDITKEAREADERREAELKEDTQGVMSGDERFSTKRLRKMLEESEAAEPPPTSGGRNIRMDPRKQTGTESRTILVPPPSAGQQRLGKMFEENEAEELQSQSTDSQAPEKEETPSVYKKPSDVQDRKSQADTVLADGKTGTPSTGTQAPDTPTSADERRATPPPKGEMARDDRGATEPRKPPSSNEQESQQRSEQEKMTSTDQRAAENMAVKDAQGETASQARHRGARDITKEAREADERREAELKEDTQGVMSGDERFSTKRLRKMLEESEAAEPPPTSGGRDIRIDPRKQTGTESRTILVPPPSAGQQRLGKMFEESEAAELKSQSTDSQAPEKEETPSVYKKPSDVQDRKSQADTVLADGKTGTPSTGTQAPDTPTSADERRATPPPKGEMARDDRGATEPRKPPSSNEQESQQRSEQEKMASQGAMSGDERFTTERLRRMLEESEAAALKSQSTDSQAPAKEETPSVHKKPSDVQDRKRQADTVLADGKTGTPLTGTQAPDTPTSADERRATPPPKGEMARDDRGATEPSKPPSSSEQESQQRSEQEKMASQGGDERFSTKRLRRMLEESEAAALKSQSTDSQAPAKEETPSVYKKPSDVQDRKSQADTVLAEGKTGTPSTSTQAPDTPTSADERRATPPPKGEMARDDRGATEPRKSPSSNEQESAPPVPSQSAPPSPIQQVSPAAPSIDELDKTAGVDRRAPPSTPKQTPTDARNALTPVQGAAPSADGISDKQSDKSTMDERALEKTPRQAPPSDTRHTSASIQGEIRVPRGPSDDMLGKTSGTGQIPTPAASKPTPTRGEVPDVHDTGDDATKKPAVDTKAAPTQQRQEPVLRSQQTTEQIKGVAPTSHGITGDELSKIAIADESATPPAPVQAPASDGRIASTALKGGILDARGKNEAVKPSVADPRGMLTTPRIPAPTPDTQRRTTSDQASDQAPPLPSFADTRNEKTDIAEAGRTNTIAPNEQPGGRIPKNAGAPAAGPSPMKSWKNMNEAHKDEPSIQQLSSDQSRAQLAENKKQGDDATTLTEIGKPKENDFLANVNQNNTGQAQVASADGPSKLQMHSDQNKPISSEDIGKRTNEIVSYRSSATSREMPPSVPEKSMREKQLQGDKSSTSLQDNVKQGSEAALLESGTEQLKKRDLLANVDQNSGKTPGEALQKSEEQTSSDTQQVKSNTGNSKSDGSSKPTQFDGNKGNLPESQRRDSSTNP